MDLSQFRHKEFDTGGPWPSPNTGNTGGSTSISQGGPLVRMAAVSARQALNGLASAALGVPVASLSVSNGVVSGGGASSVAAGVGAMATNNNVFVWSDGSVSQFGSRTNSQFVVMSSNGVGINTNVTGTNALTVLGNINFIGNLLSNGVPFAPL